MPSLCDPCDETAALLLESLENFLGARHSRERMKLGATPRAGVVDDNIWREMGDLGWLGLRVPEDRGGSGLSLLHAGSLAEGLGRAMLPEPYVACALLPSALLANLSGRPAGDLLEQVIAGKRIATLCWQERAHQQDYEPGSTVWRDGRLRGMKRFVPNADRADTLLVAASSQSGLAILEVPPDADGAIRRLQRTGDGTMRGTFEFDLSIATPLAAGSDVRGALTDALDEATLGEAAYLTGLATAILGAIVEHLNMREQFGQPLGGFQTLRHRAVDLYIECQLAGASWRRAARWWDTSEDRQSARAAISAAKARAGDAALRCGRAGVQILGGLGFSEEADMGLGLRLAHQHAFAFGSPMAHRRRFLEIGKKAA